MRAILGIDANGEYRPALNLLSRLAFPKIATTLLHACPTELPVPELAVTAPEAAANFQRVSHNRGLKALDLAMDLACPAEVHPKMKLAFGEPTETLLHEAISTNADLVAVNATPPNSWTNTFFGSVSQALVTGSPCSILVTKGGNASVKPVRVVFATDGSPFSEACLERFFKLAPKGIEQVIVVSAWNVDDVEAQILGREIAALGGDADRWIEEKVAERANKAVERFRSAGYVASARIARGGPSDVIRTAMLDTHSDLLVLGSKGRSAAANVPLGSVALQQIVAEPYPVLVLRP